MDTTDQILDVAMAASSEIHDSHDSHFDAAPIRARVNNYERAVRLATEPVVYPSRVRVW